MSGWIRNEAAVSATSSPKNLGIFSGVKAASISKVKIRVAIGADSASPQGRKRPSRPAGGTGHAS